MKSDSKPRPTFIVAVFGFICVVLQTQAIADLVISVVPDGGNARFHFAGSLDYSSVAQNGTLNGQTSDRVETSTGFGDALSFDDLNGTTQPEFESSFAFSSGDFGARIIGESGWVQFRRCF